MKKAFGKLALSSKKKADVPVQSAHAPAAAQPQQPMQAQQQQQQRFEETAASNRYGSINDQAGADVGGGHFPEAGNGYHSAQLDE